MATKDFDTGGNKDLDGNLSDDLEKENDKDKNFPEQENKSKEEKVKNAHATGDGSYGRNDGSVPEEEPKEKKGDNVY